MQAVWVEVVADGQRVRVFEHTWDHPASPEQEIERLNRLAAQHDIDIEYRRTENAGQGTYDRA